MMYKKLSEILPGLGLLTLDEVARLVGVSKASFVSGVRSGWLPGPSHGYGRRQYYRTDEVEEVRAARDLHVWERENSQRGVKRWTAERVEELVRRYKSGETQRELAERYGACQASVSRLLRGLSSAAPRSQISRPVGRPAGRRNNPKS
jgi:hypothetical protein